MRLKRFAVTAVSAVMAVQLCSCNYGYQSYRDEKKEAEIEKRISESQDISDINSKIETLLADIDISENSDTVKSDIDAIMTQLDDMSDKRNYADIERSVDFQNEKLEKKADEISADYAVMFNAALYAFSKGCKSDYADLFEGLASEEYIDYCSASYVTLKSVEKDAMSYYLNSDELLDNYFDIVYDKSLSKEEKDLKCAEIYLDILSDYSPDTFYDSYNRDYTPEEIFSLYDAVNNEFYDATKEIAESLVNDEKTAEISAKPITFENDFEVIQKYAPQLSEDIKNCADRMINEKCYSFGEYGKGYDVSYTVKICKNQSGHIYICKFGKTSDLLTAVHEFGHYCAALYDDTNAYSSVSNMDISEMQSQGFELLFSRFYGDIFGEYGDVVKKYSIQYIADGVVSSFRVGKFEYETLKNLKKMTPEKVVKSYYDIMGDYGETMEFNSFSHIFTYPGYYISYGVSALAALDLLKYTDSEPQKAVEQYEKIMKVKSDSGDVMLMQVLSDCGFSDIKDENYIKEIAEKIRSYK